MTTPTPTPCSSPAPANQNPPLLSSGDLRRICLEEGADDAGFVDIGRAALDNERADILTAYSRTRTVVCLVARLNPENISSPARHLSSDEFHHSTDTLANTGRAILRRLNDLGVRGVAEPPDFPMDMGRFPGKIWNVSHKIMAVESGLGVMGMNRLIIHPRFGNFIRLTSLLIDADLDAWGSPQEQSLCDRCGLCQSVCPVGAIGRDRPFDFMACMTHAYRDNVIGFMDMVDSVIRSEDLDAFRARFSDNETASMWQSLMYKMNYRCGYCMGVCPAARPGLLPGGRKEYVREVVLPLRNRKEQVYVAAQSPAERRALANPNKEVRRVGFSLARRQEQD